MKYGSTELKTQTEPSLKTSRSCTTARDSEVPSISMSAAVSSSGASGSLAGAPSQPARHTAPARNAARRGNVGRSRDVTVSPWLAGRGGQWRAVAQAWSVWMMVGRYRGSHYAVTIGHGCQSCHFPRVKSGKGTGAPPWATLISESSQTALSAAAS